jgi:hypothetical protein
VQVCENPDKSCLAFDIGLGFIDMNERSLDDSFYYQPLSFCVELGSAGFEATNLGCRTKMISGTSGKASILFQIY